MKTQFKATYNKILSEIATGFTGNTPQPIGSTPGLPQAGNTPKSGTPQTQVSPENKILQQIMDINNQIQALATQRDQLQKQAEELKKKAGATGYDKQIQ
jgi:hypothetical protein